MKFIEFKERFKDLTIIPSKIIFNSTAARYSDYNQIERWCKKGLLIQLRRGLYILGKNDRRIEPSHVFLAGQIYQPSYVSLEFALNYYGIIPEMVSDITSVTTRKTSRFTGEFGNFIYQKIKPEFFRGFLCQKDDNGLEYFMAESEKALADFIYLNIGRFSLINLKDVLLESYRFENLNFLNQDKIRFYFRLFGIKKMNAIAEILCEMIKEDL
jgi:hypothetical protein